MSISSSVNGPIENLTVPSGNVCRTRAQAVRSESSFRVNPVRMLEIERTDTVIFFYAMETTLTLPSVVGIQQALPFILAIPSSI